MCQPQFSARNADEVVDETWSRWRVVDNYDAPTHSRPICAMSLVVTVAMAASCWSPARPATVARNRLGTVRTARPRPSRQLVPRFGIVRRGQLQVPTCVIAAGTTMQQHASRGQALARRVEVRRFAHLLWWLGDLSDPLDPGDVRQDDVDVHVVLAFFLKHPAPVSFVPSNTPHRNVHLDLTTTADDRDDEIERLLGLRARRADVGQTGAESWDVLANPEGNEFCVVRPKTTLVE